MLLAISASWASSTPRSSAPLAAHRGVEAPVASAAAKLTMRCTRRRIGARYEPRDAEAEGDRAVASAVATGCVVAAGAPETELDRDGDADDPPPALALIGPCRVEEPAIEGRAPADGVSGSGLQGGSHLGAIAVALERRRVRRRLPEHHAIRLR